MRHFIFDGNFPTTTGKLLYVCVKDQYPTSNSEAVSFAMFYAVLLFHLQGSLLNLDWIMIGDFGLMLLRDSQVKLCEH